MFLWLRQKFKLAKIRLKGKKYFWYKIAISVAFIVDAALAFRRENKKIANGFSG